MDNEKKKGLMKAFEANSNSSKRTRICKDYIDGKISNFDQAKYKWSVDKKKNKKSKVMDSIASIELAPNSIKIAPNALEKIPHFYHPNWSECSEKYMNEPLSTRPPKDTTEVLSDDEENEFQGVSAPSNPSVLIEQKRIFGKNQLQVIDTFDGAKLMEHGSNTVPVFILVPRHMINSQNINAHSDVMHLGKVLSRYSKQTKTKSGTTSTGERGEKKTGFCERFASIGAHARRGGTGLSVTDASKIK
jgi:hypothetical protein